MKKIGLFVLAIILCLIVILVPPSDNNTLNSVEDVEQAIINSCLYEQSVDISQFNLTETALKSLVNTLRSTGQLPWYTDPNYSFRYDLKSGLVLEFIPNTLYKNTSDRELYERKVAEILNICVFDDMSECQIALSIHDYLVMNTVYDETLSKHTGFDALVNGTAVCDGYVAAYQDLLGRVGIKSIQVTSRDMAHAWILVSIDDNWYHVDITWADPVPDTAGFVSHEFFLLSDDEISSGEKPHYGWDSNLPHADTSFTNAYWQDVYSQICFASGETCYLLRSQDWANYIYARNITSGSEELLYKEKKNYVDIGAGKYVYAHQGLSLMEGKLYFNSLDKLISMNTDGSECSIEYYYDCSGNQMYIYGCFVNNGEAQMTLSDHVGNKSRLVIPLSDAYQHKHNYSKKIFHATCLEPGYALFECACGLTFHNTTEKKAEHTYKQEDVKWATLFENGYRTEKCTSCGHTITHELPQISLKDRITENFIVLMFIYIGVLLLFLA